MKTKKPRIICEVSFVALEGISFLEKRLNREAAKKMKKFLSDSLRVLVFQMFLVVKGRIIAFLEILKFRGLTLCCKNQWLE